MKNKKLSYLIVWLILLSIIFLPFTKNNSNPISDKITIERITFHGTPWQNIFIRTPFISNSNKYRFANVSLDINWDNKVDNNEWLVINTPVLVDWNTASRYTIKYPDQSLNQKKDIKTTVILSYDPMLIWNTQIKNSISKTIIISEVTNAEMWWIFSPDTKTQKETGFYYTANADHWHDETHSWTIESNSWSKSSTGVDVETIYNKIISNEYIDEKYTVNIWSTKDNDYSGDYIINNEIDIIIEEKEEITNNKPKWELPFTPPKTKRFDVEGIPDINQKYNECAPTAVANSFRWLAKKHWFNDRIPESDTDLINELKGYMEWDFWVAKWNTLKWKKEFIKERELPIEAHLIWEANDENILEKIHEELKKGQAVEVSLQYYKKDADGNLKKDWAHLVTVSWIRDYTDIGLDKWINFSDPWTHEKDWKVGSDPYMIQWNTIVNFWSWWITKIRYAVAQSPILKKDWTIIDFWSNTSLVLDKNKMLLSEQTLTSSIWAFWFFKADFSWIGDHYVWEKFNTTVIVSENWKSETIEWDWEKYKIKMIWPWKLTWKFNTSSIISPKNLEKAPDKTQVNWKKFRIEESFTCTKSWLAYIEYTANISWVKTWAWNVPEKIQKEYWKLLLAIDTITVRSPSFKCIENSKSTPETSYTETHKSFNCEWFEEDPEWKEIELLKLWKECFPKFQFRWWGNAHDNCWAGHYHWAKSDIVYSLKWTAKTDPDINACGFWKIDEIETWKIKLNQDQMSPFISVSVFEK